MQRIARVKKKTEKKKEKLQQIDITKDTASSNPKERIKTHNTLWNNGFEKENG